MARIRLKKRKAPRTAFKGGALNPGHRKNRKRTGAGRKKGTPNKFTRDVREMIVNALVELGGTNYLKQKGRRDFRTFGGLIRGVIPAEVKAGPNADEAAEAIRRRTAEMDDLMHDDDKEKKP